MVFIYFDKILAFLAVRGFLIRKLAFFWDATILGTLGCQHPDDLIYLFNRFVSHFSCSYSQNVRVRVNFGARLFLYAEGSKHRAAADLWSDSMEDIRQAFIELPFAFDLDKEEEAMDGQVVSKPSPPKPAPLNIPKDAGKGSWTFFFTTMATEGQA